jgi:hypothetical protein
LFYGLWYCAGFQVEGQGVSSCLWACSLRVATGHVRWIGRQGDDWQSLLYIEGLAQSPGVMVFIRLRGGMHCCIRTYKLPAVFLPVFSRVTS